MRRWMIIAAAVAALTGCGTSGPVTSSTSSHTSTVSPYFQAGKTFEEADYQAGDSNIAQLYGSPVTPKTWCIYVLNSAENQGSTREPGTEVPLGLPPVPVASQDDQWVAGCVAGYQAVH